MPVLPRGNSPPCDKQDPKQDPKQDTPQDAPPPPNTSPGDHTPPITHHRSDRPPRGSPFQPDPRNPTALAMTAIITRARNDGPSYIFFAALLGATFLV
jgi:hypothetical protein